MECVGAELRTAREKKSITLSQVVEATRISRTNLERLEEGKYKDLPGGVYNRAFIRAYCEYVGLESKAILARYEEEITPPGDKTARAKEKTKALREPLIKPHPLAAWGIMLMISVVGLYFSRNWIASVFSPYFAHSPTTKIAAVPVPSSPPEKKPQPAPVPPSTEPSTTTSQQTTPATAASQPAESAMRDNQPNPAPTAAKSLPTSGEQTAARVAKTSPIPTTPRRRGKIQLEIQVIDECWISVNSDGKRIVAQMLEPGENHTFDADERFFLVVGNSGGIRMKINGKPARVFGKSGEVSRVLINEQTIKDFIQNPSN